jgi:hypothetical protein
MKELKVDGVILTMLKATSKLLTDEAIGRGWTFNELLLELDETGF